MLSCLDGSRPPIPGVGRRGRIQRGKRKVTSSVRDLDPWVFILLAVVEIFVKYVNYVL